MNYQRHSHFSVLWHHHHSKYQLTIHYDVEGNTIKMTSPGNSVVEYEYDLKGQTTKTKYWKTTENTECFSTEYEYYGNGAVRSVVDAGGDTVSYIYGGVDGNGLKTGQVSKVDYEADNNKSAKLIIRYALSRKSR